MSSNTQIVKELQELSPLLSERARFAVPYQLPPGYFEALPENVLALAKHSNDINRELETMGSFLFQLDKAPVYTIPSAYFEELPIAVQCGASALDEVNNTLDNDPISSHLSEKSTPYRVPISYFEENPLHILQSIKKNTGATVIRIGAQRRWYRLAAAAVMTGIVLMSLWVWLGVPSRTNGTASVSTSVIPSSVSVSELELFLETTSNDGSSEVLYSDPSGDWNSDDLQAMLADISEAELEQYVGKSNMQNEF